MPRTQPDPRGRPTCFTTCAVRMTGRRQGRMAGPPGFQRPVLSAGRSTTVASLKISIEIFSNSSVPRKKAMGDINFKTENKIQGVIWSGWECHLKMPPSGMKGIKIID